MQKITPFLWFKDNAEQAAEFYVSIFKGSRIKEVTRYGKEGATLSGVTEGTAMTVNFQIEGQDFVALNGGPQFKFTPAVSFVVNCDSQEEVDYYWGKLSEDGEEGQCGWLTDRYGVSWQVIPVMLPKILSDQDKEKAGRAMQAMLKMKKISISDLEKA